MNRDRDRDVDDEAVPLPAKFRFFIGGDEYMVLMQVCQHLGKTATQVFATYPALYRRTATPLERQMLESAGLATSEAPIVTLLLASEVELILAKLPETHPLRGTPQERREVIVLKGLDGNDSDEAYTLTRSAHAGAIPQQPNARKAKSAPANPFSGYFRYPEGLASSSDDLPEVLVPIKIVIDEDGYKVKEQFTWNANDSTISPRAFAEMMCVEMQLPKKFIKTIANAITMQLSEFRSLAALPIPDNKQARIKLEIQMGNTLLVDQFLWDHEDPTAPAPSGSGAQTGPNTSGAALTSGTSPEVFATLLCADLGLGQEYAAQIAVAIRDQLLQDRRAALEMEEENVSEQVALHNVFRPEALDEWSPALYTLSELDIDKREKEEERENRRRRRGNRNAALEALEDTAGDNTRRGRASGARDRRANRSARTRTGRGRKDDEAEIEAALLPDADKASAFVDGALPVVEPHMSADVAQYVAQYGSAINTPIPARFTPLQKRPLPPKKDRIL